MYHDHVLYTREIMHKFDGNDPLLVWRLDSPGISNVNTFADSTSVSIFIRDDYDKLLLVKYTMIDI